jgi:hypothetical protein
MSFLHDDKAVSVDEFPRTEAPICEWCETELWMMRSDASIDDNGINTIYDFECPTCRTKKKVRRHTEGSSAPTMVPPV